jgi:hypothetical protein
MNLETQVRDRNLNPKAACIKRRSDNGDPLSGQHLNNYNPQNPNHNETDPVVSLFKNLFFSLILCWVFCKIDLTSRGSNL